MTPAARLSAAIEVLDRILAGQPAEQALTNWGRASRFAGSGDRHAVRDLVFDALRCKRSFAALGGGMTGRGLVLGGLRAAGLDPEALFTGEGHAPAQIRRDEGGRPPQGAESLDCQDWLFPKFTNALGEEANKTLMAMRHRAPVYLRVHAQRCSPAAAQMALAAEGVVTNFVQNISFALEVVDGARKIQSSSLYNDGLVELQDAASQAVIEALPLQDGQRVLDYCAGGGGKTLAMAARANLAICAHDIDPRRMRDLPARASRAGAKIEIHNRIEVSDRYDLILTDVPCSGSGSWRRDPQGKWALTPDRLAALIVTQRDILQTTAALLKPKGVLAYVTCSLLRDENEAQIDGFLAAHPDWSCSTQTRFSPLTGGDGFFLALLHPPA